MRTTARLSTAFLFFILLFHYSPAAAENYSFSYDRNNPVIGSLKVYTVNENESLIETARKFGLGYNEIMDANPGIDPFVPGTGIKVNIPTHWILPDARSYNGVVINLPEMRLYYFFKQRGADHVVTFPIGIGSEGTNTPVGNFRIIEKIINPSWHVPDSIREEKPELPPVIPPGRSNPLGSRALRLSRGDILIHGTNRPWGIGRRVSHGCIRLYPEDIIRLFKYVTKGAPVTIVRQPVKAGSAGSRIYIEVHEDHGAGSPNYLNEAVHLLTKKNLLKDISPEKLYKAVQKKSGMPVDISN